jgi:alkylation response protein AidB-like acyl-CoA dehydrogenase
VSDEDLSYFALAESSRLTGLRSAVRTWAQGDLGERVARLDFADAADFDWEMVQSGHEIGLSRLAIPPQYGGLGYGVLGVSVALEEIASVCAGAALIFGATMLGQAPVLLSGDPHLQSRFLPMFCGDDAVLACNAITEDAAGCDLLIPENAVHAAGVVTATPAGDSYLLTGRKRFITNAMVGTFGCVYANIAGSPGATGLTCFVIMLNSPGITCGPVADKLGYRACLGSDLTFDQVRVPAENIVGGPGNGMHINIQQMNMARAAVAAISTGVARGALEAAKEWCGQRVQGGKLLWQHQFSARKLAEMTASVDAARLLYLRAAQIADNRIPTPPYEPAVAKLFADRVAIDVADQAMSLMGARGYLRDNRLEKLLRDAYGARIYEGTPEVLALAITESLYCGAVDDF